MTNTFKEIRLNAKSHWNTVTKRKRNKTQMNDDINNAFECNWQRDLVPPDKHASIFCSIGEWATSITDFLHDSRFDNYTFSSERQRLALFRHYTRFFLIASEILVDFEDMIKHFNDKLKDVRAYLKDNALSYSFDEIMGYINNVCKHKFGNLKCDAKYHLCNHHIDYVFIDSKTFAPNRKNIRVANLKSHKGSKIEVPALIEVINQILYCYQRLDLVLRDKTLNIKPKLKRFIKKMTA